MADLKEMFGSVENAADLAEVCTALLNGRQMMAAGRAEWRAGVMLTAHALKRGRELCLANQDFGEWLHKRGFDFSDDDRAAYINLAEHCDTAVAALQTTVSTSVRLIWLNEVKPVVRIEAPDRVRNIAKTSRAAKPSPKTAANKTERRLEEYGHLIDGVWFCAECIDEAEADELPGQWCKRCGGEGRLYKSRYGGNDPDVWDAGPCPVCDGEGRYPAKPPKRKPPTNDTLQTVVPDEELPF